MHKDATMIAWAIAAVRSANARGIPIAATDLEACPTLSYWGNCRCRRCAVCGYQEHMAIHGPLFGATPDTEPWGHVFIPGKDT